MENDRQKSLKINMALNAIKGFMSIVFPLITFPYVSRVLGVDNLGKYNFAHSIVNYFLIVAGLGISTYAVREGARIRENKKKIELFSKEMLTINFFSMVFSYCLFIFLLLAVPKFQDYRFLLLIFSLQVLFKTIGIEWLYSIYEDYIYITIRSIVFQFISLVLLFIFVKSEADTNVYAMITVFSAVGANLLNFIHSRKYCRIGLVRSVQWKKHLKPILVLFAMSATVTIYVSSDVTILGFLCGDYTVGIYSVSTKVYTIIKTILSSVLIVSIPRLSLLIGRDDENEFNTTADDIYKTLITVVAPSVVGVIILRKEIVLLLSTNDYVSATSSLSLLAVALFFCMGAWFWGQCILVPLRLENTVFIVTIVSAIVNIGMNFVLIPLWKENGAAITTIMAEAIVFLWCGSIGKKKVKLYGLGKHYIKVLVGCLFIVIIGHLVHQLGFSNIANVCIIIPCSMVVYFIAEILMKNETVFNVFQGIKNRFGRRQ